MSDQSWAASVGGDLTFFHVAPLKLEASTFHRVLIQQECRTGTQEGRKFLRGMLSEIQKGLPGVVVSRREFTKDGH